MTKYNMTTTVTLTVDFEIEIEADSKEEAVAKIEHLIGKSLFAQVATQAFPFDPDAAVAALNDEGYEIERKDIRYADLDPSNGYPTAIEYATICNGEVESSDDDDQEAA